jgi:N-acetylmuramoyl-L-alanine amidase
MMRTGLTCLGIAIGGAAVIAMTEIGQGSADAPLQLVSRPRASRSAKIVIDPGHGGTDPGTTGRSGLHEKDFVLDVALKLAAYLRGKGVQAILTRQSDIFVSLKNRVAVADRERPDLFLSIHANSNNVHSLRGAMTLYPYDGPRESNPNPSEEAAGLIESALEPVTGCGKTRNSGVIEDVRRLRLLRQTHVPAVLVEVDYLSNGVSERKLASSAYRSAIADAIGGAVTAYLRAATGDPASAPHPQEPRSHK